MRWKRGEGKLSLEQLNKGLRQSNARYREGQDSGGLLILEARGCRRSRLGPSCQASSGQGGESGLKRRGLQGWETRLSTFSFDAALDTALLFGRGGTGGSRQRWVCRRWSVVMMTPRVLLVRVSASRNFHGCDSDSWAVD